MNQGRFVFSQLADHLPSRVFDRCVARYGGNHRVRHFTCRNQLLCMMFGQLSGRESLRDLIVGISAHRHKFHHLGFGRNVSRSNLAEANERRDFRIYEEFAYALIAEARTLCAGDPDLGIDTDGSVYAFDSTVIDLCLSVFWWAHFRRAKGGVKMHTLFDVRLSIPCFAHVTTASVHDVNALDVLVYEAGGIYILDRAYVDFGRLYTIHRCNAFFVVRAKKNFRFRRLSSRKVDRSEGLRCDQTARPTGRKQRKDYREKLRRVKVYDRERGRTIVLLTNNFELPAEQIALLYRYRWRVELFFKWVKQHLRIKSFWGTSPNAVKTQIYIALITYTLVAMIRKRTGCDRPMSEILQILSVSLLDKSPLNQLLANQENQEIKEPLSNQLEINFF